MNNDRNAGDAHVAAAGHGPPARSLVRPRRCRQCGADVARNAKRCPTCGQPLSIDVGCR